MVSRSLQNLGTCVCFQGFAYLQNSFRVFSHFFVCNAVCPMGAKFCHFYYLFYSKTFHLRKITCGLPICFSVSGRRSICIFPSLKEVLGGVGRERVCFSLGSLLVTAVWGVCPSFLPGQPYKQPCVVLAISMSPGRRWKTLGTSAAVRFVAEAFCAERCCQHHDGKNWSL